MAAPLNALLEELAEEMAQTNAAMVDFDAHSCMYHAQHEIAICDAIERVFDRISPAQLRIPSRLAELLRQRKALLPSTQRTVRALLGVCAAQSCTYPAPF